MTWNRDKYKCVVCVRENATLYFIILTYYQKRRRTNKWLLSFFFDILNRTNLSLWKSPMKQVDGKTFQDKRHLFFKEKEQIHKILVRTKEKTKPQQTDILMNECQLAYWEEKNMVIFPISAVRIVSQSSFSVYFFFFNSPNCQTSKILYIETPKGLITIE